MYPPAGRAFHAGHVVDADEGGHHIADAFDEIAAQPAGIVLFNKAFQPFMVDAPNPHTITVRFCRTIVKPMPYQFGGSVGGRLVGPVKLSPFRSVFQSRRGSLGPYRAILACRRQALDLSACHLLGIHEIELSLKVHPELRVVAEPVREPQGSVRSDGPLAANNLQQPIWRYGQLPGQFRRRHAALFQLVFDDLARMCRYFQHLAFFH